MSLGFNASNNIVAIYDRAIGRRYERIMAAHGVDPTDIRFVVLTPAGPLWADDPELGALVAVAHVDDIPTQGPKAVPSSLEDAL
jgi:hypothetical protein